MKKPNKKLGHISIDKNFPSYGNLKKLLESDSPPSTSLGNRKVLKGIMSNNGELSSISLELSNPEQTELSSETSLKTVKATLKSIHLVSKSVGANDAIFLVLDEQWQIPTRFSVKNQRGEDAAIKKLHNLAYFIDVPGKRVEYSERVADNINNGLFKKRQIIKYMENNKLKKPTLVQKSEAGILVLKNEILIKIIPTDKVPQQFISMYIDKTR